MIINHNLAANNAIRNMNTNSTTASKSMQKLSSGLRINSAADDAAGLAISEKMRGQIRGLDQASSNAQDGISLTQTAEGALNETTSILQRMRELSVQAGNDTATDSDRKAMQDETSQLKTEIDRISTTTEFNTKKLLNGSLSGATTAQGTVAASSQFNAATTVATAGTSKAGLAAALSSATTGQTGTGYSVVGGAALSDKTTIQTGVNDKFDITLNGTTTTGVQIAASPTGGYTKQQFVDALNTAVKNKLANSGDQFNQAIFSLTSDNHLQVTTAATGSSSQIKVAIAAPSAGTTETALSAMGFDSNVKSVTGAANIATGYTLNATSGSNAIKVTLGAGAATVVNLDTDGGLTAGNNYTLDQIKTALKTALDTRVGQDAISVGDDGSGHITLTSNVATKTLTIADSGVAGDTTASGTMGIAGNAAIGSAVTNTKTVGTNTVNATAAGTYISKDVNDEFNISVDGGATQSITLKAGNYATKTDLVNEINNEINNNTNLVGKVTAQADASGKISFVSNATGSSSNVQVSDPTAANQSALGVLGYKGTAGTIPVTTAVDISNGIDLSSTSNATFDVTLGNKTATLSLKGYNGINTTSGDKSSRDAIVKAMQSEFDKNFGAGAVTVNTSTTPTGTDTLVLTSNTRSEAFSISNNTTGHNGVNALFDSGIAANAAGTDSAAVSAAGVNVQAAGTDAVNNTLANSTLVTNLADKDGNNLGLKAGNVIKISGTQNGDGFESSLTVTDTTTVADIQNSLRNLSAFSGATVSLDATTGKLNISGASGSTKDISNLAFTAQNSATDTTAVGGFDKQFASFNVTQKAADTKSDSSITTQIGANQGQTMQIDINDMGTKALKIADVDLSTQKGAETATTVIDNAIQTVSAERSKLGAFQNRLEHTIANLGTSSENLTSAESRIRDVDMAKEMSTFSKNNILSQAAQAMLAQANQQPQQVLQLLR